MSEITPADAPQPRPRTATVKMPPLASPSSEATQIEQSRAIAQVQAALVVARQCPRDEIAAMGQIREACRVKELAERAFFRYKRAGTQVTGPTIHLAAELARCWGNIEFGVAELRRDHLKGESEMLAFAWDLEKNTRVPNSFIVEHRRDKTGGAVALTDLRDIYENNANQAARRLRECLLRIFPTHVKEEAIRICYETLDHGGGVPLHERREKLLEAFFGLKVTRQQIERRVGLAADKLTATDLAQLGIVYQSIKRGEISVADEFPSDPAAAVTEALKAPKAPPSGKTDKAAPAGPDPATDTPEVVSWDNELATYRQQLASCENEAAVHELIALTEPYLETAPEAVQTRFAEQSELKLMELRKPAGRRK